MDVIERIKGTLAGHPIVLFMKGTPQFPMCGFSSRTSQALKAVGADFHSVNVLEDPEIRANLPRYSNWPTFPQLFIHGELIGGCDIALELYESGELERLVQDTQKGLSMLVPVQLADGVATPAADSLRERVVLVTGATGGLGRATALATAAAGATVVLLGRKVRPLEALYDEIERLGGATPALYPMDLAGATPNDYADLAAAVMRECGRLDGLVHAAAHFDTLQPFEQQAPEEWNRTQQVNLTAPFLLTRACMPVLRRANDAAVVFVFDDPARVGNAFWGGYGVAKMGLQALASIVHEETESSSVRTHAVLPGPMRTTLRRAAYYGEDTLAHPDPAHAAQAVTWLLGAGARDVRGKVLDLR